MIISYVYLICTSLNIKMSCEKITFRYFYIMTQKFVCKNLDHKIFVLDAIFLIFFTFPNYFEDKSKNLLKRVLYNLIPSHICLLEKLSDRQITCLSRSEN